jgi:hypothetical protein
LRWRHTWPGALDGRAGIGGFSSLGRSTPTLTHTHARAHTHLTEMQPPTDVCRSLTHGRTHAEAHAHAHTSARVAGAPGVFKARTQAVSVCMRAPRCVCVSVDVRVCGGCARVRMCVPRLCVFHRPLGCRPASHSSAHLGHRSLFRVRVSSSVFSRAGPRQAKPLRAHL